MQGYNLRDAYTFILFHDKVAIQQKYNLLITHFIHFSPGQSFIGCILTWLASLGNTLLTIALG
jgi:hypothetical protein